MGEVPHWAVKIVIGYVLFILFIVTVVSIRDIDVYDLTDDQRELLTSTEGTDAIAILTRFYVLATIEPTYQSLAWLTGGLTTAFIISVAAILRSLSPLP